MLWATAVTVFQCLWKSPAPEPGRPDNRQRVEWNREPQMKHQQTPAATMQTCKSVARRGAAAWDKIPSATVLKKTCFLSFSPSSLTLFLQAQIPSLTFHSRLASFLSFTHFSSSLALYSFRRLFSCFAAQRGAEPWIPWASCHVKTLIPAKFHTQRLHLWLKEH